MPSREEVLLEHIRVLRAALTPFARMHRDGSDPNEIACRRGYASDATFVFSGDFASAHAALEQTESSQDSR